MEIKGGSVIYECMNEAHKMDFNFKNLLENEHIEIKPLINKEGAATKLVVNLYPKSEIVLKDLYLELSVEYDIEDKIFLNGYQTWTESREYSLNEQIKKLSNLLWPTHKPYGDYTVYRNTGRKGVFFGFTYSYIKRTSGVYDFFGSLSEQTGYTVYEYDVPKSLLRIKKDCERVDVNKEYKAFDLLLCSGGEEDVFQAYFEKLGVELPPKAPLAVWSYRNDDTENLQEILLDNLHTLAKERTPIDLILIDDGYQQFIGDWLPDDNKFPDGMKSLTDNIKSKGYKAGLWLAPFICETKSKLFSEHNDWVLRDSRRRPVKAGIASNEADELYVLDFYNTEVRDYIKEVFDRVIDEWGFDMVRLDYLYAVGLIHIEDKSRGQIMREALVFLKELLGDKLILASGIPLGAAFGIVDYCRIGCDINQKWEDERYKRLNFRERPSIINSIQDNIALRQLNEKIFYNAADAFILSDDKNLLSEEQRKTLFLINNLFGSLVMACEDIKDYTQEQLQLFKSMFPLKTKEQIKVTDIDDIKRIDFSIDQRNYVAYANLSEATLTVELDKEAYFESSIGFLADQKDLELKPFSSICLLKVSDKPYSIIGSTGHLFPGSEISEIRFIKDEITLTLDQKWNNQGVAYIRLPDNSIGCKVNGNYINAERQNGINLISYQCAAELEK